MGPKAWVVRCLQRLGLVRRPLEPWALTRPPVGEDLFAEFSEWAGAADEAAYRSL